MQLYGSFNVLSNSFTEKKVARPEFTLDSLMVRLLVCLNLPSILRACRLQYSINIFQPFKELIVYMIISFSCVSFDHKIAIGDAVNWYQCFECFQISFRNFKASDMPGLIGVFAKVSWWPYFISLVKNHTSVYLHMTHLFVYKYMPYKCHSCLYLPSCNFFYTTYKLYSLIPSTYIQIVDYRRVTSCIFFWQYYKFYLDILSLPLLVIGFNIPQVSFFFIYLKVEV